MDVGDVVIRGDGVAAYCCAHLLTRSGIRVALDHVDRPRLPVILLGDRAHEIGFAPVTTSPDRLYAINEQGMHGVLGQFHKLADEWLEYALRGEMHGFSNVSDTLAELVQGVNKSHPCGAALGLMGVGPSGDIAPCHRFVDSDTHAMGHISTGIDREKQKDFLSRGHINSKYDCHTCFARPLCAGGCHHEAYVRYGDIEYYR